MEEISASQLIAFIKASEKSYREPRLREQPRHEHSAQTESSAPSSSDQRRVIHDLERQINDLRKALSEFGTVIRHLTANLDDARKLIESLENNHFPTCPALHSPVQLTCGHRICRTCLSSWLEENDTCPCCVDVLQDEDWDFLDEELGTVFQTTLAGNNRESTASERHFHADQRIGARGEWVREFDSTAGPSLERHGSGLEMRQSRSTDMDEDDLPGGDLNWGRELDAEEKEC